MEINNIINLISQRKEIQAITSIATDELDGQSLANHVKQLQTVERNLHSEFEFEISKINPLNITENDLKLIENYSKAFNLLDDAHQRATQSYLRLDTINKEIFMNNYLPKGCGNLQLYDSIVAKSIPKMGDASKQKDSMKAYTSDLLKLISLENGYKNLDKLNLILEKNKPHLSSIIAVVLRPGPNQTYQAVRSNSHTAKQVPELEQLKADGKIADHKERISHTISSLKKEDFEFKDTSYSVGVNSSNELSILYPLPTFLQHMIIKPGLDTKTNTISFIYSPRYLSMHHEFNHMVRHGTGVDLEYLKTPSEFAAIYGNLEEFAAIQAENLLRLELNLAVRLTHSGAILKGMDNDSIQKFKYEMINSYFYAMIETGLIPIGKIDEINSKVLPGMNDEEKQKTLAREKSILITKYFPLNEYIIAHNQFASAWKSQTNNQQFAHISDKHEHESYFEGHILKPLIDAKLLDGNIVKYDLLSPQELKNLSHLDMQDSILFGELSVDFVKKLTDIQVEMIASTKGAASRYEIIRDIANEVYSKKITGETENQLEKKDIASDQKVYEQERQQFGKK